MSKELIVQADNLAKCTPAWINILTGYNHLKSEGYIASNNWNFYVRATFNVGPMWDEHDPQVVVYVESPTIDRFQLQVLIALNKNSMVALNEAVVSQVSDNFNLFALEKAVYESNLTIEKVNGLLMQVGDYMHDFALGRRGKLKFRL